MGQVYLMRWVFIAILKKSHTLEIRMLHFETHPKSECFNLDI